MSKYSVIKYPAIDPIIIVSDKFCQSKYIALLTLAADLIEHNPVNTNDDLRDMSSLETVTVVVPLIFVEQAKKFLFDRLGETEEARFTEKLNKLGYTLRVISYGEWISSNYGLDDGTPNGHIHQFIEDIDANVNLDIGPLIGKLKDSITGYGGLLAMSFADRNNPYLDNSLTVWESTMPDDRTSVKIISGQGLHPKQKLVTTLNIVN